MRPKSIKPIRAHGLPKIHREFFNISKFGPIIGTTVTSHCLSGKYLAGLLHLLTTTEFSLKDSFHAANRINAIPSYLFQNGYQHVSFGVESFINVPITRNVNIILRRIYQDRLISVNLKKRTLN